MSVSKVPPPSHRFMAMEDDVYTQVDYGEESGEVFQILQAATVDDFQNLKSATAASLEKRKQDKPDALENGETHDVQEKSLVAEKKRKNNLENEVEAEIEEEEEGDRDEEEEEGDKERDEGKRQKEKRRAQCLKCGAWFKNRRSLYSHSHKRSKTCIEMEKKRLAQETEASQNKEKVSAEKEKHAISVVKKHNTIPLPKKRRRDVYSFSDQQTDAEDLSKDNGNDAVPSGVDVPSVHEQKFDIDALIEQTFHINKELERLRVLREQCLANLFKASHVVVTSHK